MQDKTNTDTSAVDTTKTNAEKGIKLFFGIPAFGGLLHSPFVRSYLATQQAGLIQQVVHVDGDSLVCRARNNLTAEFLNSDCTHLLFIDTDIIFEPWHVRRLIDHAARGLPIVAGLYPKKQPDLAWVINTMQGQKTGEHGLRRLKYAGTGFMLISRDVFDRLRTAQVKEIAYVSDHGELGPDKREVRHDFWPVGVYHTKEQKENGEPGRYLSEDWFFCQNLEDLDIPVMCDMGIHTKHIGQVAYPLADVPLVDKDGNVVKKAKAPKEEVAQMDSPVEMQKHIEKIFGGEYEFENPTKDGDTIIDIGANVGGFARWAHLKWPNSKIACFEPIQDNFEFLQKNVNGIPQIQIGKFAIVGDKAGQDTIEMFKGKNNPGECSIYDLGQQSLEDKETVEIMAATELPAAQFYKIDAEGSELDIIERLNFDEAKALVCEWHRPEDRVKISKLLCENGWICERDDKRSAERGILAFAKHPKSKSEDADLS